MTTDITDDSQAAIRSEQEAGGAQIIPFRRPSAPDSAPHPAPEPDDHQPDDDGPSAA